MNFENTYDLIEDYLSNSLSGDERAIFESRLRNDPSFFQEVEAHRMANELLIDNALLDVKQELKNIHAENTTQTKSKFNKAYYVLGALVVGLIITSVLLFNEDKTAENKTIISVDETDHIIQQAPVAADVNATEKNNNSDLKKVQESKNLSIQQDHVDQIEQKSMTTSESIVPAQPAANSTLPIEVNKNSTQTNSDKNTGSKIENEKSNTIIPVYAPSTYTEKSLCEDIIIKPEYTIDQTTGDITIDAKLTQGNPPFQYSIDGGKTFYSDNEFKSGGLEKYLLVVKDQQNCKSELVEVKIPTTRNYIIYPDKQNLLEIPLVRFEGVPVTIKISNARTAVVVYQTTSSGSNTFVWDGTDQNNNPLLMGNYVYEISSLKSTLVLTGLITIVR